RRTAGPRSDLHDCRANDDWPGRLADDDVPHAGRRSLLWRHILSAGRSTQHARFPASSAKRGGSISFAARPSWEHRNPNVGRVTSRWLAAESGELLTTEILDSAYRRIAKNYDQVNGGF